MRLHGWPVASRLGISLPKLGVAYVPADSAVSSAIVGIRTESHVRSILQAAELDLSEEIVAELEEAVTV
jgi:aryl-alcohol dehydrogenase-like predicted oxidoreductase